VTEDGFILDGDLYLPRNRTTKALIHVHGWGDTYRAWQDGSPIQFIPYLAEAARREGYAFLSVNTRGQGLESELYNADGNVEITGSIYEIFEDCVLDIKSTIDELEGMGCSSVILGGHSNGANKVAHYETGTGDKRVKGLSLLSPTDDVGLIRHELGEEGFKRNLARARDIVMMGKGRQIMQSAYFGRDISAQSYFDILNQSSRYPIFNYSTGDLRILSGIQIPKLAVFGSDDGFQTKPTPREALEILDGLPNMRTVLIQGASHRLDNRKTKLARAVKEWLEELNA